LCTAAHGITTTDPSAPPRAAPAYEQPGIDSPAAQSHDIEEVDEIDLVFSQEQRSWMDLHQKRSATTTLTDVGELSLVI
jgi:hypothetical protein